jgi:NAD(P)-dependent dehydrogenase (short-subunit alcohol dehydrogenase family)
MADLKGKVGVVTGGGSGIGKATALAMARGGATLVIGNRDAAFVVDDRTSPALVTYVMRTNYNAVGAGHLLALMCQAGFTKVERLDGPFYQPVLVGNREA